MENCTVILAAGEGKRMRSSQPKVLSHVLFKPMLEWVVDAVRGADIGDICVVTGHLHQAVEAFLEQLNQALPHLPPMEHVLQSERKGTGHAVMMAGSFLQAHQGGHVLVLNGDGPFISSRLIQDSLAQHIKSGSSATVISAMVEDPMGYGRIVRGKSGDLQAIVEQKDADSETLLLREVNSGAYWFNVNDLLSVLSKIQNDNAQGEYYLPDAVKLLISQGKRVGAYTASDSNAVLGANDRNQLNQLNEIARHIVLSRLMADGVEFPCLDGILIGPDVTVGPDTCILPGTILRGKTKIGSGCVIGPSTVITNSAVGNGCTLSNVFLQQVQVEDGQTLASFTSLCT